MDAPGNSPQRGTSRVPWGVLPQARANGVENGREVAGRAGRAVGQSREEGGFRRRARVSKHRQPRLRAALAVTHDGLAGPAEVVRRERAERLRRVEGEVGDQQRGAARRELPHHRDRVGRGGQVALAQHPRERGGGGVLVAVQFDHGFGRDHAAPRGRVGQVVAQERFDRRGFGGVRAQVDVHGLAHVRVAGAPLGEEVRESGRVGHARVLERRGEEPWQWDATTRGR